MIKILDFGYKSELSKKSTIAGTSEMETAKINNEKTDIYSLGQTLYDFTGTKKDIKFNIFI